MYKLTTGTLIIHLPDGSESITITDDPASSDYTTYLAWLVAGNTPLPADLPTQYQLFEAIDNKINEHFQAVAKSDGWDSRSTCTDRAGYLNPWQNKAIAYATWVDNCCLYMLTEQAKISAGTRTMPTPDEAVAELPIFVWPV